MTTKYRALMVTTPGGPEALRCVDLPLEPPDDPPEPLAPAEAPPAPGLPLEAGPPGPSGQTIAYRLQTARAVAPGTHATQPPMTNDSRARAA